MTASKKTFVTEYAKEMGIGPVADVISELVDCVVDKQSLTKRDVEKVYRNFEAACNIELKRTLEYFVDELVGTDFISIRQGNDILRNSGTINPRPTNRKH